MAPSRSLLSLRICGESISLDIVSIALNATACLASTLSSLWFKLAKSTLTSSSVAVIDLIVAFSTPQVVAIPARTIPKVSSSRGPNSSIFC